MIFLSIWKQEEAIKGNLFSVQESTYSVLLSYFYIKRKMNSIKEKAVVKRVLAKKSWRRRRRSHAIKWHRDHLLRMLKGFISPSSNVVNIKQMLSKYKYYVRIVYITCAKSIPIHCSYQRPTFPPLSDVMIAKIIVRQMTRNPKIAHKPTNVPYNHVICFR